MCNELGPGLSPFPRSIGTESYLALPKGGIDDNHVLIVPVSHHANTVQAPGAVVKEMGVFANALRKCVGGAGDILRARSRKRVFTPCCCWYPVSGCRSYEERGMSLVMFERAVRTRGASHTHYQAFGVPKVR